MKSVRMQIWKGYGGGFLFLKIRLSPFYKPILLKRKNDILSLHPSQIPQLDSRTLARAAPNDPAAVGHGVRGR
jgi:hypothetical protein